MQAARAGLRLLAGRLRASPDVTQGRSFAVAAEPALAHDQGRWDANYAAVLHGTNVRPRAAVSSDSHAVAWLMHGLLQDLRFERHPLPQELAPDSVRIRCVTPVRPASSACTALTLALADPARQGSVGLTFTSWNTRVNIPLRTSLRLHAQS